MTSPWKGYTKIGVLYENFIEGKELSSAETAAFKAAGLTTTVQSFPTTALNITPEVQALENAHVQAVDVSGLGQPVGLALKARATLGWTAPFVGDALVSGTFDPKGVSATDLKGVNWLVQSTTVYKAHESQAFQTFYKDVLKQGPIDVPIFEYAAGWDVVMLADDAAKQAGSITGPAMAKALEGLKKPKTVNYVLGTDETYSPTNHALKIPIQVVPMQPPDGGLYNVPAGAKLP